MAAFHELRLAIDGGKSKTDAALIGPDGTVLRRSTGPGLEIVTLPNAHLLVEASLRTTLAPFELTAPVHTVSFGLNGVQAPGRGADLARDVLARVAQANRYVVASDAVMTFVGAIGIRPGVAVAAGTGTAVLGIGVDGHAHRVDCNGPLYADRGSGYDVGRRGLESALRVADGLPGSQALFDQVVERFGGFEEALEATYTSDNPSRLIASFSRNVAEAALAGDAFSREVYALAGRELAHSAVAAAVKCSIADDDYPIAWTGGLFGVGDLLLEPFTTELASIAPTATVAPARGGALDGGIELTMSEHPVLVDVTSWSTGVPA